MTTTATTHSTTGARIEQLVREQRKEFSLERAAKIQTLMMIRDRLANLEQTTH